MKRNNRKIENRIFDASVALPMSVLSAGLTLLPAAAHATIAQPEEVIVTARRTEEVIQNVPISMTVFNQDMLNERNVTSGADLINYTPSLNVNNRFGSDQASFAIRGFTQELRTTASVAVYFADVVAPRGGGSVTAGDGAGPGSFFDLQNVQVLKGPQGTLFGRNTTGGAIQLVPQEPTNKLEGYLEESLGNYNMRRTQGVVNVPLSETVRTRFGVDTQKRDGYLKNISGVGPNHLANVDYIAGRASLIAELTRDIQNYTIFTYTNSENNGNIQQTFACNPNSPIKFVCQPTLDLLKGDFYAVASGDVPDPTSKLKQWQVINTTTWNASDNLTIKNILSYADLKQTMRTSIFGTDFVMGQNHIALYNNLSAPGMDTNAQKSFVEELQFSGSALREDLTWQSGLYFEDSKPDGLSGTLSSIFMSCPQGITSADPAAWQCVDPAPGHPGSVQSNIGEIEYKNMAAYSQSTYDISDEFRVTFGLRYTVDKTDATGYQKTYSGFDASTLSGPDLTKTACIITTSTTAEDCRQHLTQKSEAPTWLIDFDYLPTPDAMVYAKYARGYRMGSINIFGGEGLQVFEPEKVDAYEIGTKTSFRAPISGTFNLAAFYNELDNQQIQFGLTGPGVAGTTAIVNAGASTIQGIEAETTLRLLDDLTFNLAYTYLDTRVKSLVNPALPALYTDAVPSAIQGGPLTFSPHHTGTAALNYRLPLPAEIGDVSIGASLSYTGKQMATLTSDLDPVHGTPYGELDQRKLVNMNVNWKGIFRSGFDASVFVTNLTQQKYTTYVAGMYQTTAGIESRVVGEPRMAGIRVKYNFQ